MPQDRHYPPTNRFRPPIATAPRRQPPSDPTNTVIIFILVILFLLFFIFFLRPSSSHAPKTIKPKIIAGVWAQGVFPKIMKPATPVKVKSNWNSFIVFLFLFAIIAGILAQNNNPHVPNRVNNRTSETNRNRNQEVQVNGDLRRRPYLRQNPFPENGDNNNSRRREERKDNIHRSEPFSGDVRHSSHLNDARKVVPNVPEIIVQRRRQSPIRVRPASKHKPPLPTKSNNYHHDRDDFVSSSSHSQSSSSIPIPIPPPPPPPCKVPPRKFKLHGDYVELLSVRSSDFSSPDRDDLRSTIIDGGDSFGPSPISSTSSSPGINAKADRFISKNRDEWRTEKEEIRWARAH